MLKDERQVTLREIRESDADEIVQAFDRLSKDSRFARFMHHKQQINEQALHKGVRPKPGREFVYVATVPAADGIDVVGAAQYVPAAGSDTSTDADTCEFAITVADDWRGSGLAKELLASLVRRARRDGYVAMEGFVLSSNRPMLGLAKRLKFVATPDADDSQVTTVRRSLLAPPKSPPALVAQPPPTA